MVKTSTSGKKMRQIPVVEGLKDKIKANCISRIRTSNQDKNLMKYWKHVTESQKYGIYPENVTVNSSRSI